ncbi:hypothetical protein O988_05882 [Pseudogymnoascus sp. VKM F-3808]|nr:hypothetical protein O988_05882 [Pseudogymnoascus sp. VKM F-3808]
MADHRCHGTIRSTVHIAALRSSSVPPNPAPHRRPAMTNNGSGWSHLPVKAPSVAALKRMARLGAADSQPEGVKDGVTTGVHGAKFKSSSLLIVSARLPVGVCASAAASSAPAHSLLSRLSSQCVKTLSSKAAPRRPASPERYSRCRDRSTTTGEV